SGAPERVQSLFEDKLGRIWITAATGFGRMEKDRFVPTPRFPEGNGVVIVEDPSGNLWIAVQSIGLIRLSPHGEIRQIPRTRIGGSGDVLSMAADSRGGIWLGFYPSGLTYFKDGRVSASYSAAEGLGKGMVKDLRLGRGSELWASTEG